MDYVILGAVIKELKKLPENTVFINGFHDAHSWRGSYEDVAFEPISNMTAAALIQECESAIGETFEGWKGGDYKMTEDSCFHVAVQGSSGPYSKHVLFLAELMDYMDNPEQLFIFG